MGISLLRRDGVLHGDGEFILALQCRDDDWAGSISVFEDVGGKLTAYPCRRLKLGSAEHVLRESRFHHREAVGP